MDNVPILHGVIGVVSKDVFRRVMRFYRFQSWCYVYDKRGRLPIHIAAECGIKWDEEMKDIVDANLFGASEVDALTGLYPFLLAASCTGKNDSNGNGCDLTSIYQLAKCNPNCVGLQS